MPAYKDKKTGLFYVQFYYRDARGARRHKNKKGFQTELEALVSVNIFFTISTNIFSPIAPSLFRRSRQRGCAASG